MNKTIKKECESSCDYILPDYLGDVRKVLSVSANAVPAGKFVNDGEMHLSGTVNYNILYSDSENKLSEINVSSDYETVIQMSGEGCTDSYVDTRVANFAVRLTGPRKLSAKASVRCAAVIASMSNVECIGDAFSEGLEPEVDKQTVNEEELLFGTSFEREYAEEAERVEATADSIEIISSSGLVRINESSPVDGGVNIKGDIIITAIIKTDGGAPYAIKRNIPFDETVEIEGADGEMQTVADGYLTSVRASCNDNADGGSCVTVSAIAEFSAIGARNRQISVIRDAYLKEAETVASYATTKYTELCKVGNVSEKFSGEVLKSDVGAEDIQSILTVSADPRSQENKICAGMLSVTGEIAITAVACQINDELDAQYLPVKFNLPYAVNINCNCHLNDEMQAECKVMASDAACYIDGDKISVECALDVTYHVFESKEAVRMTECSIKQDGENYSSSASLITVYYPEPGETLFEIAKKYHRSGKNILADNELSVETSLSDSAALVGVKKLIIR